jgi:hypothetical protein
MVVAEGDTGDGVVLVAESVRAGVEDQKKNLWPSRVRVYLKVGECGK